MLPRGVDPLHLLPPASPPPPACCSGGPPARHRAGDGAGGGQPRGSAHLARPGVQPARRGALQLLRLPAPHDHQVGGGGGGPWSGQSTSARPSPVKLLFVSLAAHDHRVGGGGLGQFSPAPSSQPAVFLSVLLMVEPVQLLVQPSSAPSSSSYCAPTLYYSRTVLYYTVLHCTAPYYTYTTLYYIHFTRECLNSCVPLSSACGRQLRAQAPGRVLCALHHGESPPAAGRARPLDGCPPVRLPAHLPACWMAARTPACLAASPPACLLYGCLPACPRARLVLRAASHSLCPLPPALLLCCSTHPPAHPPTPLPIHSRTHPAPACRGCLTWTWTPSARGMWTRWGRRATMCSWWRSLTRCR